MSFWKDFREDWREMQKSMEPMPNPPDHVSDPKLVQKMRKIPLTAHASIVKETFDTYKKMWTDPALAVREIEIDEELIRQIRREREDELRRELNMLTDEEEQEELVSNANSDIDELIEKVKNMFPEDVKVHDVETAVQALKDRRGDMQDIASERLEVVGASISEFMVGYREGKENAIAEVTHEDSPYFKGMDDYIEESKDKDINQEKEKAHTRSDSEKGK